MRTHEEMKALALSRSAVRTEYERIEREEMPLLDMVLTARREAGLSQAQIAERVGTQCTSAVSRLEKALITGKPSPSIATLQKYAAAIGKHVEVRFV
ncbi:XRE family transcriptional regulator (plasmid) [Acinetobacter nosocomialis]|nr:XRE family transcriptional regulator [Acinetobacter nosocomialis]